MDKERVRKTRNDYYEANKVEINKPRRKQYGEKRKLRPNSYEVSQKKKNLRGSSSSEKGANATTLSTDFATIGNQGLFGQEICNNFDYHEICNNFDYRQCNQYIIM
ncbi:hypothetical protein Leryth_009070, partial [Lithospermum erythrorhizon]